LPADMSVAIVVLLHDQKDAEALARLLQDFSLPEAGLTVLCPPIRGRSFFAAAEAQPYLDMWWRESVPAVATPIYLVEHEPALPPWLRGIDGECFVGAPDPAPSAAYADLPHVRPIAAHHPLVYAIAVMDRLGPGVFDEQQHERLRRFVSRLPAARMSEPLVVADAPHPLELLTHLNPRSDVERPPAEPHAAQGGARPARARRGTAAIRVPAWVRLVGSHRDDQPAVDDAELARAFARRRSTIIAVGSRKGGVGKTSHAAGIAVASGECLDLIGHRAAIVDANIANPDAWGQLNLSAGALTVRRAIAALVAGDDVPEPVYASTPALACYPETREATEYSHLEIARFATYLRSRYTVVVIDLTNRIPDVTAGPEAAVAAFWLEQADVAVLPTASAKQDFNGVLDYLEVPGLPPTVVAHIRARSRRNREHPLARQYLEAIGCRCARMVELPDEAERVRYAVLEGLPVQDVSPALRQAYRQLAQAVADVATTVPA
jgi:MinD-like ATPase involved in chromosome partitioning or flagellar assembly